MNWSPSLTVPLVSVYVKRSFSVFRVIGIVFSVHLHAVGRFGDTADDYQIKID